MTKEEIQVLAWKFLNGTATKEEEKLLHEWYETEEDPGKTLLIVSEKDESTHEVRKRLFNNIELKKSAGKERKGRKYFPLYAASAALAVLFSMAYFYKGEEPEQEISYTKVLKDDVSPGGNSAVLELAGGKVINLDNRHTGALAHEDGVLFSKAADGILSVMDDRKSEEGKISYNIIRIPKGGQYQLQLNDGTKVWLNSASSLRFPSRFTGNIRQVEVKGEAYFEVASLKDTKKKLIPFLVKTAVQQIEVIGTHFNVNSYDDEEADKTTLLEGSVRVMPLGSTKAELLVPGQEANVSNGKVEVRPGNIETAVAWKNGDFIFNNEDIKSIMHKLERWYDIEIVYENGIPSQTFSGVVSRSKNLSAVLNIMEQTGKVVFKIIGRRVYVMT